MPSDFRFRLSDSISADIDALAASINSDPRGDDSRAVKEAIAQWRRAVHDAGQANGDELTDDEWIVLGHLQDVSDTPCADDDGGEYGTNWSLRIAQELRGMYAGRTSVPGDPSPVIAKKLAAKIERWDRVRGYAIMAALRWMWQCGGDHLRMRDPDAWMTPMLDLPTLAGRKK